jgi:hypothetical protein
LIRCTRTNPLYFFLRFLNRFFADSFLPCKFIRADLFAFTSGRVVAHRLFIALSPLPTHEHHTTHGYKGEREIREQTRSPQEAHVFAIFHVDVRTRNHEYKMSRFLSCVKNCVLENFPLSQQLQYECFLTIFRYFIS